MFGVDGGVWIDLKGVIVMCRLLKEAKERVEHFMAQQEEELAARVVRRCVQEVYTEKARHSPTHPHRETLSSTASSIHSAGIA